MIQTKKWRENASIANICITFIPDRINNNKRLSKIKPPEQNVKVFEGIFKSQRIIHK